MYTLGHHNNVYPEYIRYSDIDKHEQMYTLGPQMYTLGPHNNVYPKYIRYSDKVKHQQCIPWVIITMCIQST